MHLPPFQCQRCVEFVAKNKTWWLAVGEKRAKKVKKRRRKPVANVVMSMVTGTRFLNM